MLKDRKDYTAFSLPYNDISDSTSEDILDMVKSNEFYLISNLLPYAEKPKNQTK